MAKKRIVKIILDTNWYISATINRRSRRILFEILTNPNLQIIYSKEILQEYLEVMRRPKFRKFVSKNQIQRFINLILPQLSEVSITTTVQISRDKDDDYLLAMAIENDADYLVTGDLDLLVLQEIGKTKILKMSEFQMIINV